MAFYEVWENEKPLKTQMPFSLWLINGYCVSIYNNKSCGSNTCYWKMDDDDFGLKQGFEYKVQVSKHQSKL